MMNKIFLLIFILFLGVASLSARAFAALTQAQIDASLRPKMEYTASDKLKDPFVSGLKEDKPELKQQVAQKEQPVAPPNLEVEGIIFGGKAPCAIINNKVVKEGDNLGEVKIIKIDKEKILVSLNGKEFSFPSPAKAPNKSPNKPLPGERNIF